MNIEECIIEFKKMLERDKDTLRYWKSDIFGHYDEPIKKLEKDILISETLLTAYEKEKEKNKELTDEYMIQKHLINPDFLKDYISKDKIREIIKEINNKGFNNEINYSEFYYKTEVLKKILEEE